MYRFFISSGDVSGETLTVSGPDAHHIAHVLRMRPGEDFEAVDENGLVYTCRLASIERDDLPGGEEPGRSRSKDADVPNRRHGKSARQAETVVKAQILFTEKNGSELPNKIVLYMGLPKFEKMELIIQKAVELGVSEIVPVVTARTVVKLDAKKAGAKQERWQAIAEAAAKQSKRAVIPEVSQVMSFKDALKEAASCDKLLIPYEKAEGMASTKAVISGIKPGESLGVFIGPEGGFEESEVVSAMEAGAQALTLGPRILRCETAAITTLSVLMFALTD